MIKLRGFFDPPDENGRLKSKLDLVGEFLDEGTGIEANVVGELSLVLFEEVIFFFVECFFLDPPKNGAPLMASIVAFENKISMEVDAIVQESVKYVDEQMVHGHSLNSTIWFDYLNELFYDQFEDIIS